MSSIIIMSLPGVHNQVKKLHNTITSLEFCISNNTKVSSPIQRYPLHRCWTGISQSLVLAIEIKSIKFNIHFWKKMAEKRAVKQSLTWMADNIKYYSMWKSLTHSPSLSGTTFQKIRNLTQVSQKYTEYCPEYE